MIPDYIEKEIKKIVKKILCCNAGEILISNFIVPGQPAGNYTFGINSSTGQIYTVNSSGNWLEFATTGAGVQDFVIVKSQLGNPYKLTIFEDPTGDGTVQLEKL